MHDDKTYPYKYNLTAHSGWKNNGLKTILRYTITCLHLQMFDILLPLHGHAILFYHNHAINWDVLKVETFHG